MEIEGGSAAICPKIAQILFSMGIPNYEQATKIRTTLSPGRTKNNPIYDEFVKQHRYALDAFESSIHVEPDFLLAYVNLALLKLMVHNDDEAREFCNQGLNRIEKMKEVPQPSDMRGTIENVETCLQEILRDMLSN